MASTIIMTVVLLVAVTTVLFFAILRILNG